MLLFLTIATCMNKNRHSFTKCRHTWLNIMFVSRFGFHPKVHMYISCCACQALCYGDASFHSAHVQSHYALKQALVVADIVDSLSLSLPVLSILLGAIRFSWSAPCMTERRCAQPSCESSSACSRSVDSSCAIRNSERHTHTYTCACTCK